MSRKKKLLRVPRLESLERRDLLATVISGADSGPGTLREALASATSGETITFDPGVTTVTLTNGELVIPTGVTITGPALSFTHPSPTDCGTATTATGGVTITQTLPGSRVMKIDDPTNNPATPASSFADVTLENLVLTGGATDAISANGGDGAGVLSLEHLTLRRVLVTGNTVTDATMANTLENDGGGISHGNESNYAGNLVVEDSVLEFNSAIDDAAAFDHFNANDFTMTGSRVRCNVTGDLLGTNIGTVSSGFARVIDGAGLFSAQEINIQSSYFSGNSMEAISTMTNPAPTAFGGLMIFGHESGLVVNIEDSTFSGNSHALMDSYDADAEAPDGRGGALFLRGINATITGSTFSGNESYASGGAIVVENDTLGTDDFSATVTITNTTITGNTTCLFGGGVHIYAESGTVPPEVFIFDSDISNNAATGCPSARSRAKLAPANGRGGGASAVSKSVNLIRLEIDPTTISNNTAADVGGGLYLRDVDALLEETTVSGNTAASGGGGIQIYGDAGAATASLDIVNSTISNNSATSGAPAAGGGGIAAGGSGLGDVTVSVVQSTLSGNSAAGDGGGIEVNDISSLTVQRSLLSSNLAAGSGGSISITDTATLIENATISGNSATGDGGGIWKSGTPITEVAFSTLTLNSATDGGGIFNANGPFDLNNTIVSDNSATGTGADFYDPMGGATITYSLVEDPTGNTAGMDMSNIVSMSAMLGPLMDQGGITLTHRPMEGSPAIGVADFGAAPPSDQRGYSRPGGTRDLGALETDGVLDADFTEDGIFDCDDIDALTTAVVNGGILALFDLNADAMLDITDVDLWRTEAGAVNLTSGNPYLVGDANLDGVVDGFDLLIWNANKFTANSRWCSSDFNVDGFVNGSDYILWVLNRFENADPPPPIPTPVGPPGHKAVARLDKQSEVPADPPIPTISSLPLQPQLPSAPQHKKLFDFRNDVTAEWRNASDELMASDMDWVVDLPSFISKPIARFT